MQTCGGVLVVRAEPCIWAAHCGVCHPLILMSPGLIGFLITALSPLDTWPTELKRVIQRKSSLLLHISCQRAQGSGQTLLISGFARDMLEPTYIFVSVWGHVCAVTLLLLTQHSCVMCAAGRLAAAAVTWPAPVNVRASMWLRNSPRHGSTFSATDDLFTRSSQDHESLGQGPVRAAEAGAGQTAGEGRELKTGDGRHSVWETSPGLQGMLGRNSPPREFG